MAGPTPIPGQLTTVLDLLSFTFRQSGIISDGEAPSFRQTNDAWTILNNMLATWNRQRWLVYNEVTFNYLSDGNESFTIGPGASLNVVRPNKIESAYFTPTSTQQGANGPVDYQLQIIAARETYNLITMKEIGTWPSYLFYDSAYPLGNVYVWPIPQAGAYTIHLTVQNTLTGYGSLFDTLNLPPEYTDALVWNIAARLRPLYSMDPDPAITTLAQRGLDVVRGSNMQIPSMLPMPGMPGMRGSRGITPQEFYSGMM